MRFFVIAALFSVLVLSAGCAGGRVFLEFTSPDHTPLHNGSVSVKCGYLVRSDKSGKPTENTLLERFSPCGSSATVSVPGEIIWVVIEASYPGHIPLSFKLAKLGQTAAKPFEMTDLDLHYVHDDIKIVGKGNNVTVGAALRFP